MNLLLPSSRGVRVKKFLLCLVLGGLPYASKALPAPSSIPDEIKSYGFERRGADLAMAPTKAFPNMNPSSHISGRYSVVVYPLIESLMPYPSPGGRHRPAIVEDLYYETLLVKDPVERSDRLYPLIARSIRFPQKLNYVIFELDARATFQDQSRVTAQDIAYSLEVRLDRDSEFRRRYEMYVRKVVPMEREIRFDISGTEQQRREMIYDLSQIKVVKPSSKYLPYLINGIDISYISTGPYLFQTVAKNRVTLQRDPYYWGSQVPSRQGFFKLAEIEILAAESEKSALLMLGGSMANFYQLQRRELLANGAARSYQVPPGLELRTEPNRTAGKRLRSLSFDLSKAVLADPRVRRAILLAFDFDEYNQSLYHGELKRPHSMMEESPYGPAGMPMPDVSSLMVKTCGEYLPSEALLDSATYGHADYDNFRSREGRLLTARALLSEAGFSLVGPYAYQRDGKGNLIQVKLQIVVREPAEQLAAEYLSRGLEALGIRSTVQMIEDEIEFRKVARSAHIVSNPDTMITRDGQPDLAPPDSFRARLSYGSPCYSRLVSRIRLTDPRTREYRMLAEAAARVHQASYMNIFIGEPKLLKFAVFPELYVPSGLSLEGAHMYGSWPSKPGF